MSRVGNCWDNAVVESLWASLKNELVLPADLRHPAAGQGRGLRVDRRVVQSQTKHSSLGYVSPEAFEAQQN